MSKELATYVLPFLIPALGGLLGTLLEALGTRFKIPALVALGQRIEGLLMDLPKVIRGSRATAAANAAASAAKLRESVDSDKDDDDQNPPTPRSRPPLIPAACLPMVCLAFVLLACTSTGTPREPTKDELDKACPGAARAMAVDCPALAISKCGDAKTLAECPDREAVEAECDELIEKEINKCR